MPKTLEELQIDREVERCMQSQIRANERANYELFHTPVREAIAKDWRKKNLGRKWNAYLGKSLFRELGIPSHIYSNLTNGSPWPKWFTEATWLRKILNA
jgi:hypothetical protein